MRVLVAAASKYGGTAGIAEAIGRRLEDVGFEAETVPIDEVGSLDAYDAFVLGSGVYAGRWLKPARRFVEAHEEELASKPTWLFSSGPIGDPPKPEGETAVKLDDVIDATGTRGHRVFAGKLDKSVLRFGDRAIVSAVRSAEGDFRDWDDIHAWADEIAAALTPSTAVVAGSKS